MITLEISDSYPKKLTTKVHLSYGIFTRHANKLFLANHVDGLVAPDSLWSIQQTN